MKKLGKIAILGAGKMGETLISRLLGARVVGHEDIVATARTRGRLQALKQSYRVKTSLSNREAAQFADLVILCVKPQTVESVLSEITEGMTSQQLLISIAASVSTGRIEASLKQKVPVVRAMPNTPCLIGMGMTVLSVGRYARQRHMKKAEMMFQHLGRVLTVDEKYLDAVTGLSASGPAFTYVVIESMAEGGVKAGLPRKLATQLAAQAVLGGAGMVLETEEHPALLKDAVTTPAGCTIDGLMELEEGGLRVTMIKSVVKSAQRAAELVEGQ